MIPQQQQPPQQMHASITGTRILWIGVVVLTIKSSFAFVSFLPLQSQQMVTQRSSRTLQQKQWRMVLTTAPSEQSVDEEYLTALQNFAAASITTNSTDLASTTEESSSSLANGNNANNNKISWRDDGFVFGLKDSTLQRPTGKQALIVVEGDSMETKPYQVALVTITLLNHLYYMVTSGIELYTTTSHSNSMISGAIGDYAIVTTTAIHIIALSIGSWIAADFGSGVLHWSVDNYGNGRTPIMGNIIAAFQGHHTAPWTITQRSFYNNVYKLCIPFGIIPVTLFAYLTGPALTYFLTVFCALEILSQEFHKWSHQTKSETPYIGNILQQYQLAIGRVPHFKHHTIPFETNYCIISGICNPILDQSGFFRRFEHFIYNINGIESNAWKLDPILRQRTLDGNYTLPELYLLHE